MKILVRNNCDNGTLGHFLLSVFRVVDLFNEDETMRRKRKFDIVFDSIYQGGSAFNCVVDQTKSKEDPDIILEGHRRSPLLENGGIMYNGEILSKNSLTYKNLKKILSKVAFKKHIIKKVNNFFLKKLTDKTLGVHIRLTDMNYWHSEHGVYDFSHYLDKINRIEKKYDKIFVSSDNYESIKKLKDIYGNKIIHYPNFKFKNETEDDYSFISKTKQFADSEEAWIELFIEVLTLSKCKHLIGRNSAVSLSAILFSNNMRLLNNHTLLSHGG
tara:strand:- start:921 stop:1733 length:813 start_codon:yes stop_codon:yes gene_type:complete